MSMLPRDEFEQERRKQLQILQEQAAKWRIDALGEKSWGAIMTRESTRDGFMWVPRDPLETRMQQTRNITKAVAEECRFAICQHCKGIGEIEDRYGKRQGVAVKDPIFGGFLEHGAEYWYHEIEESNWINRLLSKFGFTRQIRKRKRPCAASQIIKAFRLIDVPPAQGAGINSKAYAEAYPKPFNDPTIP